MIPTAGARNNVVHNNRPSLLLVCFPILKVAYSWQKAAIETIFDG